MEGIFDIIKCRIVLDKFLLQLLTKPPNVMPNCMVFIAGSKTSMYAFLFGAHCSGWSEVVYRQH